MEIKPKLNINIGKGAKNSTASSNYYPCGPWKASHDLYNPWQVVWYHSAYHLDPGQQPFSYQSNDYSYIGFIDSTKSYDFKVVEGQDKCHIIEHFKNADGTENVGAQTDAGYELTGISGKDMIGEKNQSDPENAKIRGGFEKYDIFFDNPGDVTFTINEVGSSDIYYFHTIIVRPDFNLNVSLSGIIAYGEEAKINAEARRTECTDYDEMYNGGGFDGKYNYEIVEGGEYATLSRAYFDEAFLVNAREEGQSFEGTEDEVYLYMNGLEPLDSAFVTVKISTTDADVNTITQVVKVVPNDYYELGVAINPSELNAGDTADVILSQKVAGSDTSANGGYDYEPFPSDQIFNASIVEGAEYAYLYDPVEGTSDSELTDVEQGFKLIINPGVDTNNVEIKIKVSTTISDGTGSSLTVYKGNNHPAKVVSTTTTTATHKFKKKVNSSGTNKTAFIGIPSGKQIFGIGKATIGNNIIVQFEPAELSPGDTAVVHIYKKGSGGELIAFPQGQKFEVGLLDGCDYGDLLIDSVRGTYFTNVEEPIKYIVEDSINVDSAKVSLRVGIVTTANQSAPQIQPTANAVNYSKRKGTYSTASKAKNINKLTATSCSLQPFVYDEYGTGISKIRQKIELEIIEPNIPNFVDYIISMVPEMPEILAKARLNNFNGGAVRFIFTYIIQWTDERDNPHRIIRDEFNDTVEVKNSEIAESMIHWNGIFRGGDENSISVKAIPEENYGIEYNKTINNPFTISGLNPSKQEIKEGLTLQEQVVVYKESRWRQFLINGYPIWAPRHGYGLMQLDPPDNNQQIWNWRINRAEGQNRLAERYDWGIGYPARLRSWAGTKRPLCYSNVTDFTTEEERWKEGFQLYNGGHNWAWYVDGDIKDPNSGGHWVQIVYNNQYGVDAWNLYINVLNENLPNDWN